METNEDTGRTDNRVVRLHGAELQRFLVRMLGREDLAHEIAERAFGLLESTEGVTGVALRVLVFDIATQFAIEHMRAQKQGESLGQTRPAGSSAPSVLERQQKLAGAMNQLTSVIDEMDPTLRQVFVMRYVTRKARQEIAKELRTSVEDVEQKLQQALSFCRGRLPDFE